MTFGLERLSLKANSSDGGFCCAELCGCRRLIKQRLVAAISIMTFGFCFYRCVFPASEPERPGKHDAAVALLHLHFVIMRGCDCAILNSAASSLPCSSRQRGGMGVVVREGAGGEGSRGGHESWVNMWWAAAQAAGRSCRCHRLPPKWIFFLFFFFFFPKGAEPTETHLLSEVPPSLRVSD